jgi:hypothetical protein
MAALTQQIQSQDSEYALLQDMMQLQSSFQVLVEPVEHVRKGFLSTLHGSCIIVAVSHAPSMRHTREDLDEVTNLWTRRKNSSTSEVPQNRACTYSMKIDKAASSMIWKELAMVVHILE